MIRTVTVSISIWKRIIKIGGNETAQFGVRLIAPLYDYTKGRCTYAKLKLVLKAAPTLKTSLEIDAICEAWV